MAISRRSPKINWDKLFVSNKTIHLQWKKNCSALPKTTDVFPVSIAMVNTDLVNPY